MRQGCDRSFSFGTYACLLDSVYPVSASGKEYWGTQTNKNKCPDSGNFQFNTRLVVTQYFCGRETVFLWAAEIRFEYRWKERWERVEISSSPEHPLQ